MPWPVFTFSKINRNSDVALLNSSLVSIREVTSLSAFASTLCKVSVPAAVNFRNSSIACWVVLDSLRSLLRCLGQIGQSFIEIFFIIRVADNIIGVVYKESSGS